MYPPEFEFLTATSVEEAVQLLGRLGEDARILAGGQSLVPMMKLRIASPRYLIDVNGIAALAGLRDEGDRLIIGALCRHAELAASPLVRQRLSIMTDAARQTADVQVRNRGTVGGSLAHADPAGDWPAVLLALDAQVTMTGGGGTRTLPLETFLVDAYTTALADDEMITQVAVPYPASPCGGAYVKFEKRSGDFGVASVGVQLELDPGDRLRRVAISLGAVGPRPVRAPAAEDLLQGHPASADRLADAERLARETADPLADTRGSVDYKRHLAGVLFRRAFVAALDRARGKDIDIVRP